MSCSITREDGGINLKGLKWTKDSLATSGLALANLIDQPKFENNMIHVRFCYAAELIRDMQQAVNSWLEDYFLIEEALEEYNDMQSFLTKKGFRNEFLDYQSQIYSQNHQNG